MLVTQSCLTLCDPVDCSPLSSSVHGDSPGKNTGMGSYALLQGVFPNQGLNPSLLHCRQILSCLSHLLGTGAAGKRQTWFSLGEFAAWGWRRYCFLFEWKIQRLGLCWERQKGMWGHMEHPGQVRSRRWKGFEAKAREMAPKGRKGGWGQIVYFTRREASHHCSKISVFLLVPSISGLF